MSRGRFLPSLESPDTCALHTARSLGRRLMRGCPCDLRLKSTPAALSRRRLYLARCRGGEGIRRQGFQVSGRGPGLIYLAS